MYTVEMDGKDAEIYVLDETGSDMDVHLIFTDGIVFIRQTDPTTETTDVISLTEQMFEKIINAYHSPEGVYND